MRSFNRRTVIAGSAAFGAGLVATRYARAQSPQDFAASKASANPLAQRREYVIRNAHLLTMDSQLGEIPAGDVHVRNGAIVAVGSNISAPNAEVIEGRGMICMPGFVDTHWHLWNCNCRQWVRTTDNRYSYFPLTSRIGVRTTPADAYRAARFGLAEGLLSGITTVHNWCHNTRGPGWADAEISAMRDMGIRGRYSYGGPQQGPTDKAMDLVDLARAKKDWFADPATTDSRLSLGICSRNLVPGQSLRGTITFDIAQRDWGGARELGLPITLHASPKDLVFELEKQRLLGSDVQLVHPMFTAAEERAILKSRGTSFSSSPIGEVQRPPDGGVVQINELLQSGVLTSLSLDETVAGNADFFNVMRVMFKYDKHRVGEGADNLVTTKRLVELATIEGAKALGLDKLTGSLTVGKRADLILVGGDEFNIAPMANPWDAIVLHAQPSNLSLVMADGRVLAKGGKLSGIDHGKILHEVRESNTRLAAFADPA
ncbi:MULTISPECIES: amidohydrolase family protein [unclassified Beijerinckia]|uniref:amidohydrolase family protein n=1 Tax=unclassified Beijerinckia TaxID=2638183 RepID=UPI00148124BC|nr:MULTISPECIES: amidohydrolase family protein [unclassified Beijerinckia]